MKLSKERIQNLQELLKGLHGLDYSSEQAQEAGAAILRFVVAKAQRRHEITKDKENGHG